MNDPEVIYLFFKACCYSKDDRDFVAKYENNQNSLVFRIGTDDNEPAPDGKYYDIMGNEADGSSQYAITTTRETLKENKWLDDLKYQCRRTPWHMDYYLNLGSYTNAIKLQHYYDMHHKDERLGMVNLLFGDKEEDKSVYNDPEYVSINSKDIKVMFKGHPESAFICIDRKLLRRVYMGTQRFKKVQEAYNRISNAMKNVEDVLGPAPAIEYLRNDYKKLGEILMDFLKDDNIND